MCPVSIFLFSDHLKYAEYFWGASKKVYKIQRKEKPDWKGCGMNSFFIWILQLFLCDKWNSILALLAWYSFLLTFFLVMLVKVRTDRSVSYFDGDDNPHLARLRDILLTYSFYNFDLGYCQVRCNFHPSQLLYSTFLGESSSQIYVESSIDAFLLQMAAYKLIHVCGFTYCCCNFVPSAILSFYLIYWLMH